MNKTAKKQNVAADVTAEQAKHELIAHYAVTLDADKKTLTLEPTSEAVTVLVKPESQKLRNWRAYVEDVDAVYPESRKVFSVFTVARCYGFTKARAMQHKCEPKAFLDIASWKEAYNRIYSQEEHNTRLA